ncbi:hypothetical protein F53441_14720 [Fusarium austroafricanum]|uniref:Uncharacterized protein n=1 Tax=Fusarium austroafricanum TaxID=2364996 RepID=A0A8H4NA37_9HYPO|nr:hypothetical protein F53441_14720 [Fusarium austroafricanum]
MSSTDTNNKLQKTGRLQLPNKLLSLIMCWKADFSIHPVSSRFFQLAFKQACSRADVELMIECLKYKNVPTSQLWGPVGEPGVEQYQTPLDILLQGYLDDSFSVRASSDGISVLQLALFYPQSY